MVSVLSIIGLLGLEDDEPPPPQEIRNKIQINDINFINNMKIRKCYFSSKLSDSDFISFLSTNIAIRFGIDTSATTTYAIFHTIVVSITAANTKQST